MRYFASAAVNRCWAAAILRGLPKRSLHAPELTVHVLAATRWEEDG